MTLWRVVAREAALRDVDEAVDHYLLEGGENLALPFIDALQRAYRRIARHPGIGSPRYAHELGIDGLRAWPVRRFPQVIFYLQRQDHLDIWRVLHAARDIPGWLRE